jgi:O-antigen/teichoic acid export membrane protein
VPASILSNTALASAGRIINVALGLLVVKLVTGFLGPSGYGAYALLLSFGAILQLVADGGLYLQLTRSIAQAPHRESELISHILSLRIILLSLVFVIGAGILATLPAGTSLTRSFMIIALGLSFQSISQLFMGIFQYHQAVWRATVGDLVGRLGQIISVIFFGLTGANGKSGRHTR